MGIGAEGHAARPDDVIVEAEMEDTLDVVDDIMLFICVPEAAFLLFDRLPDDLVILYSQGLQLAGQGHDGIDFITADFGGAFLPASDQRRYQERRANDFESSDLRHLNFLVQAAIACWGVPGHEPG